METKKKAVKKTAAKAKKPAAAKHEPKAFSVPVFNAGGKEVGTFLFDKEIFTGKVNKAVLYQAVRMYEANRRQGNAATKTRGDVSGGGKKPWRQKGTGRARAGSSRSPLWRGGGSIFGPHPRDYYYTLPKAIRRLALLASINSKLSENKIIGIDALVMKEPKTKNFQAMMDALKLKGKSLFVLDAVDINIEKASRNLKSVSVKNYRDFNTMDVLRSDTVVISKASLEKLPERVKA